MKYLIILCLIIHSLSSFSQRNVGNISQNQKIFERDSINKDEIVSGVVELVPLKESTNSRNDFVTNRRRVTVYLFVDTLSTNAGYMNFILNNYASAKGRFATLETIYVTDATGSWDTILFYEGNMEYFKSEIIPVDTTQAIRTEGFIVDDFVR